MSFHAARRHNATLRRRAENERQSTLLTLDDGLLEKIIAATPNDRFAATLTCRTLRSVAKGKTETRPYLETASPQLLVWYFHQDLNKYRAMAVCAQKGYLKSLESMHDAGYDLFSLYTYTGTISDEVRQWLWNSAMPVDTEAPLKALRRGEYLLLDRLLERGMRLDMQDSRVLKCVSNEVYVPRLILRKLHGYDIPRTRVLDPIVAEKVFKPASNQKHTYVRGVKMVFK